MYIIRRSGNILATNVVCLIIIIIIILGIYTTSVMTVPQNRKFIPFRPEQFDHKEISNNNNNNNDKQQSPIEDVWSNNNNNNNNDKQQSPIEDVWSLLPLLSPQRIAPRNLMLKNLDLHHRFSDIENFNDGVPVNIKSHNDQDKRDIILLHDDDNDDDNNNNNNNNNDDDNSQLIINKYQENRNNDKITDIKSDNIDKINYQIDGVIPVKKYDEEDIKKIKKVRLPNDKQLELNPVKLNGNIDGNIIKLSKEIDKNSERNVDHRMAAIDDDAVGVGVTTQPPVANDVADDGGRGIFSTDPKDGTSKNMAGQGDTLRYHFEMTDWTKDAGNWLYKGNDWTLVDIPDEEYPGIPAPKVPGKALVVVTDNFLKKAHFHRVFTDFRNVTLQFSYFLSEPLTPLAPLATLTVYAIQDAVSNIISQPQHRGVWSHDSADVPVSGNFEIVFEGLLSSDENHIALDDISVGGYRGPLANQEKDEGAVEKDPKTDVDIAIPGGSTETNKNPVDSVGNVTNSEDPKETTETNPGNSGDVNNSEGKTETTEVNPGSTGDNPDITSTTTYSEDTNVTNTDTGMNTTISSTDSSGSGIGNVIVDDGPTEYFGTLEVLTIITIVIFVVILIFYVRRRRLRNDEIHLFTRRGYTDFQNPTFSNDDVEVNGAGLATSTSPSGAAANNYRSFQK